MRVRDGDLLFEPAEPASALRPAPVAFVCASRSPGSPRAASDPACLLRALLIAHNLRPHSPARPGTPARATPAADPRPGISIPLNLFLDFSKSNDRDIYPWHRQTPSVGPPLLPCRGAASLRPCPQRLCAHSASST